MDDNSIRIEIYQQAPAVCLDYDPRAATIADLVGSVIVSRLPNVVVEHIGSTSVPGCAGKGIVDLQLLYREGELDSAKAALVELGFQPQISRDPFPEDRPMRVGAVLFDTVLFRIHVHVVWMTAPEVSLVRSFRDRLRSDAMFREAYVAVKRDILARGITDSLEYAHAKSEFVRSALAEMGT